MKRLFPALLLLAIPYSIAWKQIGPRPGSDYLQFNSDGAWCWFSDPRAVYYHSKSGTQVISGWVKSDGTIEAGSLDLTTRKVSSAALWPGLEIDDHDNPAFVETPDGSVLAQYAKHGTGKLYQNRTDRTGAVGSFSAADSMDVIDPAELEKFPRSTITYANPFRLSRENNRLYSFGRWTGFKPNIMWSDDNGIRWSKARVLITNTPFNADNRPYVKYFSDGKSRIHIVFTDGHPRNEPVNSVYYACYEKGNFYRADGSKICSINELPFEPTQASVVYRVTGESGKAWVFDLAATKDGHPVILYTRYPTDADHRYHYAIYKGGQWIDHEICRAGKWFPRTPEGKQEPEPNYSAGLTLHPRKINTVYLAREVNGVFEIEKRVTNDYGASWSVYPVTRGSRYDNVRPYVPRNYQKGDPDVVLWMQNTGYIHYLHFSANIRYFVEE